jgi:hypothetical protein
LTLFFGSSGTPTELRAIAKGQPGDLCLLSAAPTEVLEELDSHMVAATVVAGQVVFER